MALPQPIKYQTENPEFKQHAEALTKLASFHENCCIASTLRKARASKYRLLQSAMELELLRLGYDLDELLRLPDPVDVV